MIVVSQLKFQHYFVFFKIIEARFVLVFVGFVYGRFHINIREAHKRHHVELF